VSAATGTLVIDGVDYGRPSQWQVYDALSGRVSASAVRLLDGWWALDITGPPGTEYAMRMSDQAFREIYRVPSDG